MPAKKQSGKSKPAKVRASIPSTLQVVPPAFRKVFMAYHALGTVTEAAASTGGIYQFRLNSVYDPDYTGVGTTAMGYTAVSGLYSLFRVVRARVVARLSLNTTGQAVVGILPGLNSTLTATYHMLEAEPNASSRVVQGNVGGAHAIAEFNTVYQLSKICGVTNSQYMDDFDFAHPSAGNPLKSVYLNVFMAGNSGAAQTMIYNVRIIYEVELSQPLQNVTA